MDDADVIPSRTSYLLDGRRVRLRDLIQAGLLKPGDELVYKRPRMKEAHKTTVTDLGWLRLDTGEEFKSPSRAAAVAADVRAVDGWRAWSLMRAKRTLDSLRQELLDSAASDSGVAVDVVGSVPPARVSKVQRHEWLKEARQRADANQPIEISVREFLWYWGSKSRGYLVCQKVEADLANHGLSTSPSFRKVSLDAEIKIVSVSREPVGERDQENDDDAAIAVGSDAEEDDADVRITIGNLTSALGGVVFVSPTSTFEEAATQLLINDFSQLAVLAGTHSLRGAVTWKSIALARYKDPDAKFADAIVSAQLVNYDRDLFEILPVLREEDFVFVADERKAIAGIVTNADVVEAYGEMATPFFLVGELDQRLRQIISKTFELEEIQSICDPKKERSISTFDDLTMGDYKHLLQNRESWQKLGWNLDRRVFAKRLDEIREIRNDLMHFNPDPLPPDLVGMLRNFIRLLRSFGG